jgi:hypothetical protein
MRCVHVLVFMLAGFGVGSSISPSVQAATCRAGAKAFTISTVALCVPKGTGGYAVRSAGPSLLRFEEQYFVGAARVVDVDPRSLKRPDGTKATSVMTTIRSNAHREYLQVSIREALVQGAADLHSGRPVTIHRDGGLYGDFTLEFSKRSDGKFEGTTRLADRALMPFDYWLVAMEENGSIDYILSCSKSGDGDRLQYACDGDFEVGAATAKVSLFAPETAGLDDSFEANRKTIVSFVTP